MDEDFAWRATMRTNEELNERINNREKYLPETVEAAVFELVDRNVVFSEEELRVIAEDMQARREQARSDEGNSGIFSRSDEARHVEDPEAPAYYSKRVILVFSILFSVLFGSVLMAINLSKTKEKGSAVMAVLFGLGFTFMMSFIGQRVNLGIAFTLLTGFLGAYLLDSLFWSKYIGNSSLYRPKPFWPPLLVGMAIVIPLVFYLMKYGPQVVK